MKEIIDKYIRKRLNIDGNVIYLTDSTSIMIRNNIWDIFGENGFKLQLWFAENVSNVHCINHNGKKIVWYKGTKMHRDDGPALSFPNGTQHWFVDGVKHREDGPAIIWNCGHEEYYLQGKQHTKKEWKRFLTNT